MAKRQAALPQPVSHGVEIDGGKLALWEALGTPDEIPEVGQRRIQRGFELEFSFEFGRFNRRHVP
jgi:hypothetical protein